MKPDSLSLTAVYVPTPEGGFAAYVDEIPGVNTQGESLEEAKKNLSCIIHAFNLGQMQGVESRRHSGLFQGFRNEADGPK